MTLSCPVLCPCTLLLVLNARMNILDMYWICFYFTYSKMYQPPRKSKLLDFNLVINVFKKCVKKTKTCIFKGLSQHFIDWLSFGSQMLCLCLCWWTEWTRTNMCMIKLSFFPHTHIITLFGRSTRNTLSSLQKLCSSPDYLAQPGKALAIMGLSGITLMVEDSSCTQLHALNTKFSSVTWMI